MKDLNFSLYKVIALESLFIIHLPKSLIYGSPFFLKGFFYEKTRIEASSRETWAASLHLPASTFMRIFSNVLNRGYHYLCGSVLPIANQDFKLMDYVSVIDISARPGATT